MSHVKRLLFCLFFVSSALFASDISFVYPLSLHWYKGAYYIGDRGIPAFFRVKDGKRSLVYTTQDSNKKLNIPIGLTDDGKQSLIDADPGTCALSKINLATHTLKRFSPPPPKPTDGVCAGGITRAQDKHYYFVSLGSKGIVTVNAKGNTRKLISNVFEHPFGITSYHDDKRGLMFGVLSSREGALYTYKARDSLPKRFLCNGKKLPFPYDIVSLDNTFYFDDAILNHLYAYDRKTNQCRLLSKGFIKPLGLTVSGSKIGIIDAGKRALLEYDPKTKQIKTIIQDKRTLTSLGQPWDMYVSSDAVFVSDYKRGGVLKIDKKTRKISVVTSPRRGRGAPILTAEALTGTPNNKNVMYLSDGTLTSIFKVDLKTGDHTFMPKPYQKSGVAMQEPTSMTYKDGTLYVADWAGSQVLRVNSQGIRQRLSKLSSPPFAIAGDKKGRLYVSQPKAPGLSSINMKTGKHTKIALQCDKPIVPFGIEVLGENQLLVTDAKHNQINQITLTKDNIGHCKVLATIPKKGKDKLWFVRRFDKTHLIASVFWGPYLYLVNIKTGEVSRFI